MTPPRTTAELVSALIAADPGGAAAVRVGLAGDRRAYRVLDLAYQGGAVILLLDDDAPEPEPPRRRQRLRVALEESR